MATDQFSSLKSTISSYNDREKTLQDKISASPTYYGNSTPSNIDISNQVAIKKLQTARQTAEDKLLKEQWYGPNSSATGTTAPPKESMLQRTLNVLSAPNYAIVGAAEAITGKGATPGFGNIIQNVTTNKETWGDLLTKFNVPGSVAAPAGFMLDVATDPLNWYTMGTDSLIPRIGVGAVKGLTEGAGIKGVTKGIESSMLGKATAAITAAATRGITKVGESLPYLKDNESFIKKLGGLKSLSTNVTNTIAKAGSEYNSIIGKDVMKELTEKAAKAEAGTLWRQSAKGWIEELGGTQAWLKKMPSNIETVKGWLSSKPGINLFSKDPVRDAKLLEVWNAAKPQGADEAISWMKSKPIGKTIIDGFFPNSDWMKNSLAADASLKASRESGELVEGRQNIINRFEEATGIRPYAELEMYQKKYKQLGEEGYLKWLANKQIDEGALAATDASKQAKLLHPDDAGSALEGEFMNDRVNRKAFEANAKKVDANYVPEDVSGMVGPGATPEELAQATTGVLKNINTARQKTGVGWYDDMGKWFKDFKVQDVEVGKKIANSYDLLLNGFFKLGKIGGNLPGAMLRATIGNHTMALMAGLDAWRPEYLNQTTKAFLFLNGRMSVENSSRFLEESFFKNPKWVETLSNNPETFQATFGVHPSFFDQEPAQTAKDIFRTAKNEGVDLSGVAYKDIAKTIDELKATGVNVQVVKTKGPISPGATEIAMKNATSDMAGAATAVKSTMLPEEMMGGSFQKFIQSVEKKLAENPNSKSLKLLDWYLKRPMNIFSSADGSSKLGYALVMTNKGLSEKEVSMVSRFYPMIAKDMELDKATGLYKINPIQAIGAVNEVFMNYSTMPEAIKVLRSMPLMGAPFGSFMYGMGVKTGKTAAYNPAIFNKINYFLKEFQSNKTPLERQQLQGSYYSWYNKDGMFSLPFFQDNPVYLNVADMIPYYTMNMLQPSDRTVADEGALPSGIKSVFDKLPFFQQPEGQVLMDYFILPTILRESNPKGKFGQALWKYDSTNLEKFGYAARALAETPLPTAIGLTGVVGGKLAPEATEYVPSFRYRQLANAVQGKTSVGVTGQEDPVARTFRVLSGVFGLPWYRMNLSYTKK